MQQIENALRDEERSHIVFVLVENLMLRREAIAELGERLSGQRYLREFDYAQTEQRSLPRFCRSIPRRELPVCVCAYGLEALADRPTDDYQTALELLNNHREDVRDSQAALILWVSSQIFQELLQQAPDFAAWRDATIELPLDCNAEIATTAIGRLTLEEAEDYRRDVRRYDEMLTRPNLPAYHVSEFRQQRNIALAALGRNCDEEESNPVVSFSGDLHRFLTLDSAFYLDYILRRNEYMDPRGVMQTTRSAMLKLDEVYVSLKAERQVERTWTRDRFNKPGRDYETELFDEWEQRELERFQLKAQEKRTESVELPVAVKANARMVVLGDPGAGKTTLMRFLALHFARAVQQNETIVRDAENEEYGEACLPIFVRISRYAEYLREHPATSLRRFLPLAFDELNMAPEKLQRLFDDALRAKRAFVLLDGLDEVIAPGDRAQIATRIDEFVSANPGNRFLVTSRIAGYRIAPLGSEFAEFTLEDMETEQIHRFLQRWCLAYERHLTPDAPESDVQDRATVEVADVERALQDNLGVRRLATNPLLLTILCLIKRNGAHMPRRRVELYELATQTLLRDWQLHRGIPGVQCVEEDEALRLLGPLALWLHETKPTGMASKRDVQEHLADLLAKQRGKEPDGEEVTKAVDDFLRRVREHTGLFVERAPGYFGFMHLTFEEYYVGRELLRRYKTTAKTIYKHRHQPRWEEPILLAIGYESKSRPEYASDLIRSAILAQGEEAQEEGFQPGAYENVLHRDLLFAAHCLGDCAGAETSLIRDVAGKLVSLYMDRTGAGKYRPLRERLLARMAYLGDTEAGRETTRLLLHALNDEDNNVRRYAVEALGQTGQSSGEVVSALLHALNDEDNNVRRYAVEALGRLGQSSGEVVSALLHACKDEDKNVRASAVQALGRLGQSSGEVVSALLHACKDEDNNVRRYAVQALGQTGQSSGEVVSALLHACKDEDKNVRASAVEALGQTGQSSGEVVSALLHALNDEDNNVRWSAVEALGQTGQSSGEVVSALLHALNDEDNNVRWSAVQALGRLGQSSGEVVSALLHACKDEDKNVRRYAVQALGRLGQSSGEVVSALLHACKDEDKNVRASAVQALGQTGQSSGEVVSALLHACKDEDKNVRASAAESLTKLFTRRSTSCDAVNFISVQQFLFQAMGASINETMPGFTPYHSVADAIWDALWTVCAYVEASASAAASG